PIDSLLLTRTLVRWADGKGSKTRIEARINKEPTTDEPTWDINTALKRVKGRRDRLATLLGMFQKSTPEMLHKLKESAECNDRKNIEAHAHALKGTSGNLAFMRLYQACITLEVMPAETSLDALIAQVDNIEAAYKDTQILIMDFLTNNKES
ncbi:Hpt domain-containing protein, partial [Halorubrum tibetense]